MEQKPAPGQRIAEIKERRAKVSEFIRLRLLAAKDTGNEKLAALWEKRKGLNEVAETEEIRSALERRNGQA